MHPGQSLHIEVSPVGCTCDGGALTGQGQQFVANKDGRIVLMSIEGILAPIAQKRLHGSAQVIGLLAKCCLVETATSRAC